MSEERTYLVYILASQLYGTLYIGLTNSLYGRVSQHREGKGGGFTKKYGVTQLMWFQEFAYIEDAIQREKSLKRWPRVWKTNIIERTNPDWHDLFPAMQKYDPQLIAGASAGMGPGHAPSADASDLAQDDT